MPYGTVDGQTAVGVQAAAQTFFAKPAKNLTLEESALLAGLPQAPSELNPFQNPKAALERRNEVLQKMAKLGYISEAARRRRRAHRRCGVRRGDLYTKIREPFFFDYVKQQLIDRFGVNTVRKGGLQRVHDDRPEAAGGGPQGDRLDAQLPRPTRARRWSRSIRATATSARWRRAPTTSHNQYNLAAQGHRQPGSAFKTFVLTTAIKRGINPNSTGYVSKPLDLNTKDYGPWKVQTYDHTYGGYMNLVRATLRSDNTVFAQLDLDLGPKSVADTAKEMGITTKLDGYPAEGLGGLTRGVSPLEMANAYATLASGRHPQQADRDHEGRGSPTATSRTSASPSASACSRTRSPTRSTKILKMNVQQGTGTRANIGCPAGGQDRHHRQLQRRLVRRLHAAPGGGGVGRLSRTRCGRCAASTASRSRAAPSRPRSGTSS